MKFKDGVIHVLPNGTAFDEEIIKDQSKELAEAGEHAIVTIGKRLVSIVKSIIDFISDFFKSIRKRIDRLDVKEIIKRIDNEQNMRKSWHSPKNIIMNHQVLNRKPMFSHIRNRI